MANLDFYSSKFGIHDVDAAFRRFLSTLRTYYDADYYVNWQTVFRKAKQFERELALLSTLCNKDDKEQAARELLTAYPQVIRALPSLIGCRDHVSIMEDADEGRMLTYEFQELGPQFTEREAERYTRFLVSSGLIELLEHVSSVPDYVTGVEVGMDSNGRKNRSGKCAIKALSPHVQQVTCGFPNLALKPEANHAFLASIGCHLPSSFKNIKWDWAFWSKSHPKRFALMEVNHYGGTGSKPMEIVRGYLGRQKALTELGIAFLWVTDGLGWTQMEDALRDGFDEIDYLMNIQLASKGQLEWALCRALFPETEPG